ncbi:MAG: TetR/AcrR family transcriptional regulator [Anaerolineales bacterium]
MSRIKQAEHQQIMEQTRQRLLEAAAVEFARAGFAGANINRISTTAGYAKGTIYNYFPSKQAVLLALIDATAQAHLDFMLEQARPETEPRRRLERFFQAGFAFTALYLPQATVVFNCLNGSDEGLKTHIYAVYQPLIQFLAGEILAPGIQQGLFRPVEPGPTALLLMTIYMGTTSQHDAQGKPWLDPLQVTSLILNGLQR